jgi:hypothetical protein
VVIKANAATSADRPTIGLDYAETRFSKLDKMNTSRNERLGRLLGLDHAHSVAKRTYMATDTIKGAQLALEIGPTLDGIHQRYQARACERRLRDPEQRFPSR